MITWMQRHRKYLVITIWISTIAFIGAGFVGWGQYSYGDKSGAVAKVGDVSITNRELQKAYSQLFNRYSQMFQGQFDQEQAKKFGLDKQALRQLIDEALLLNLANSYNLEATDAEVAAVLQSQQAFFENGAFSKTLYQKVLKQNRLTPTEYEADLRKSLLIQKLLALFPTTAAPIETDAFETALGIADKIEYKIITDDMVTVDLSEKALKAYWEAHKNDYMTDRMYKIAYIEQSPVSTDAGEEEAKAYFEAHKHDFTGPDGKLLDYATAKSAVLAALNDKATNKAALKTYIAFKKGKLSDNVTVHEAVVGEDDNLFSPATLQAIAKADPLKPYLKPKKEGNRYVIIKRLEVIEPVEKSFAAAKEEVRADYLRKARSDKMLALAKAEVKAFKGTTTKTYLKRTDTEGIDGLNPDETQELLGAVFKSDKPYGAAGLKSHKMVLYRIVDQTIEQQDDPQIASAVMQTKSALFNRGLITALSKRYETKIFIEGFGE